MEFEGLLLALIVGMAIYIILNRSDQRHPGHRFGQQNPNQPYYGDDYDNYDNYQQPNYPQQYGGNQPIIIMPGGGYPYPPRHYREDEGSSLPAVMLVILALAIGAAVYYRSAPEKVVYVPYPNSEQVTPETEPPGQNGQGLALGNPEQLREQKVKVVPTILTVPEEKIERFRPTKNSHVVYLSDYSSQEGVRALMGIYPKKKIVGVEINGVYWACVLTNSEDAAWDELESWKRYENDYRSYGLDPKIRDLRDYCDELSWNTEHDMLICE
jgi:hypothetical protein